MKRWISTAVFVVVLVIVAIVFRAPLIEWFHGTHDDSATRGGPASSGGATTADAPDAIDHYTCPMHPSVHQHAPGKCPICGMDLVPVTKRQIAEGIVTIDDARRQLIGVKTAPVVEGPITRTIRAVGQVAYDESKLSDVTVRVQGFITKLFVNETGQRVSAGQPLFQLYSPDLYSAEQDFLLSSQPGAMAGAPTGSRVEGLARAARQRLRLLGLTDAQIDAVAKKGAPLDSVTIASPKSGFVIEKNVVEGAAVEPGMRLFRVAALSQVWVEADVYEGDLPEVRLGQAARVSLDYVPGRFYDAKVSYVYPYLDPQARTGRVRIELSNAALELRPGMYATVEMTSEARTGLRVPASAVVYTGPRRLVFKDVGGGRLRPTEVQVGAEADGMVEVRSGLTAGDVIVTSGVFLVAAEARIATASTFWDDKGATALTPAHVPLPPPAPETPPRRVPAKPAPLPSPAISSVAPSAVSATAPSAPSVEAVYTCPMHPEVRSPTPGKCPKCGMDLVLAPKGAP